MLLAETLGRMRQRRPSLRKSGESVRNRSDLLQSCIPSYCHGNWIASFVAWSRLIAARNLAARFASPHPILDFGSGSGELAGVLDRGTPYFYIERSEELSQLVLRNTPAAVRLTVADLPRAYFGSIFCLDSLEHNADYPEIVAQLWRALHPEGTLILSGPTENFLYRAGRALAGFSGHYHEADVFRIEEELRKHGKAVFRRYTPFGVPFFAISAWRKTAHAEK